MTRKPVSFCIAGRSGRDAISFHRMGAGGAGCFLVDGAQAKRAPGQNGLLKKSVQAGHGGWRLWGRP